MRANNNTATQPLLQSDGASENFTSHFTVTSITAATSSSQTSATTAVSVSKSIAIPTISTTTVDDSFLHNEVVWDLVMSYEIDDDKEKFDVEKDMQRRAVVIKLRDIGFQMLAYENVTKEYVHIALRCDMSTLEREAERIKYSVPIHESMKTESRSRVGATTNHPKAIYYKDFNSANRSHYLPFQSVDRQILMRSLMTSPESAGGANLDLEKLVNDKIFCFVFPLHNDEERHHVYNVWFQRRPWFQLYKMQYVPDWELRNYFGEKSAFYFVWLSHYTQWLVPLSVLGVVTGVLRWTVSSKSHNHLLPVYCLLLCMWCDMFIESWKRKQNELQFVWNVRDFELEEKPRKEFRGELRRGVYTTGGHFLSLDHVADDLVDSMEKFFPVWKRLFRQFTSLPIILTFVVATVAGTIALLVFRTFEVNQQGATVGGIVSGVLNAIFITVMNVAYAKAAEALNNFENHRTATQHEDALIIKTFIFQFINSYVSLFYIAFVKDDPGWVVDDNHSRTIEGQRVGTCVGSCMDELFTQLATLVIFKQFASNFVEVGFPFLKKQFRLRCVRASSADRRDVVVAQSKLRQSINDQVSAPVFEGTFYEYNEMLIQFGYVTLFAAAFPLASVSSWVNNVIELRTDGIKFLYGSRRPFHQSDNDIGSWMYILQSLSVIAVITNCFIVGFTSDYLRGTRSEDSTTHEIECSGYCLSSWTRLIIVIVVEHSLLFFKVILNVVVDDTPAWVHQEIAKQQLDKRIPKKHLSTTARQQTAQDEMFRKSVFDICGPTTTDIAGHNMQ
eukprot:c11613_g1_i1.p1 GENE.c11613_g1_i1~~c11613_g1_i1.p1  ORF type:complete len:786 (+),score=190.77 c11613_g1_i1:94-2451(+)